MRTQLSLLILAVPLVEIALFVLAGEALGLWWTLGLTVLSAVLGVALIRRQGMVAMRRLEATAAQPIPAAAVFDGAAIVAAGILLLTPGFFTDLVALVLLLPPVRQLLRRRAWRHLRVYVHPAAAGDATVIDGEARVVDDPGVVNDPGVGDDPGRPSLPPRNPSSRDAP
ncbi:MAG: FxsA family protein [Alphaproteobacteria bacterium]